MLLRADINDLWFNCSKLWFRSCARKCKFTLPEFTFRVTSLVGKFKRMSGSVDSVLHFKPLKFQEYEKNYDRIGEKHVICRNVFECCTA